MAVEEEGGVGGDLLAGKVSPGQGIGCEWDTGEKVGQGNHGRLQSPHIRLPPR